MANENLFEKLSTSSGRGTSKKEYAIPAFTADPKRLAHLVGICEAALAIEELGFRRRDPFCQSYTKEDDEARRRGWEITEYVRGVSADGTILRLSMHLHEHATYGTVIAIASLPYEERFQFSTPAPLTPDKVVPTLRAYLESVRQGKKYVLPAEPSAA